MVVVLITGCVLALVIHRMRVRAAEAAYQQAKLAREVSEIALVEYVEGMVEQNVKRVEGEISLAEADLKIAEAGLGRSRRETERANAAEAETASNEQDVRRAQLQLHEAQKRKMTLEATRIRTIEELKSELEKARVVERAMKANYTRANERWMSALSW
jgi:HlyD family secretion protein